MTFMEENKNKIYVEVNAEFYPDGRLVPKEIIWENGKHYAIDKVIDSRRASSLKAGGCGIRYTCRIMGGEHYLFYEENYRWFVEARHR